MLNVAPGWQKRLIQPLVFLLLGAVFLLVTSFPATCPLRLLTHIPCPSCGLTRAVRFACVADFPAAFRMHPLWLPALVFVLYWAGRESYFYVVEARIAKPLPKIAAAIGWVLFVALVALWIARFFGGFGGPVAV